MLPASYLDSALVPFPSPETCHTFCPLIHMARVCLQGHKLDFLPKAQIFSKIDTETHEEAICSSQDPGLLAMCPGMWMCAHQSARDMAPRVCATPASTPWGQEP